MELFDQIKVFSLLHDLANLKCFHKIFCYWWFNIFQQNIKTFYYQRVNQLYSLPLTIITTPIQKKGEK